MSQTLQRRIFTIARAFALRRRAQELLEDQPLPVGELSWLFHFACSQSVVEVRREYLYKAKLARAELGWHPLQGQFFAGASCHIEIELPLRARYELYHMIGRGRLGDSRDAKQG